MALRIEGRTITDTDELADVWSEYFYKLGSPSDDPSYDQAYREQVTADLSAIRTILAAQGSTPDKVTIPEVLRAIKKLNSGKTPDPTGIRAEHLLKTACTLAPYLCNLYTAVLERCHIPQVLQIGQ